MLPQLPVQSSSSTLGYEDNVIFAVPGCRAQTFKLVHRDSSFRVLGGSRLEVSTVDNPLKSQTSTASPAEPGGLFLQLDRYCKLTGSEPPAAPINPAETILVFANSMNALTARGSWRRLR